jgi:DNA-binding transcriptional regulator/RsmH inhibitor MraZ
MSGDFLGSFKNSVHKMRVIIPASFKAKFAAAAKQSVIVTLGKGNNNVVIYPLDNWNTLSLRLKNGDPREQKMYNRMISWACAPQELEGPGRVRISDDLIEITGIKDNVLILGEGSFISVWDPDVFKNIRLAQTTEEKDDFTSSDYQV